MATKVQKNMVKQFYFTFMEETICTFF